MKMLWEGGILSCVASIKGNLLIIMFIVTEQFRRKMEYSQFINNDLLNSELKRFIYA